MVSADPQAISAVLPTPSDIAITTGRPADWTSDWFVYLVPDISDEVAAAITKAKAWPAFNAVFRHLRRCYRRAEAAGRKGDEVAAGRAAACQAGILDDEGIRGLARSIGVSPKAMSRQIAALQAIGILAAFRPPASMTRDHATGRIVRRPCKAGRVEAARIVLTLGDDHRRPANRQGIDRPLKAPGRTTDTKADRRRLRVDRTPSQDVSKGRSDTTPISQRTISLSTPPAAGQGGRRVEDTRQRPDGRRGGLTAADQDKDRRDGSDAKRPDSVTCEATPAPPAEAKTDTQHPTHEATGPVGHLDPPDRRTGDDTRPPGVRPSGHGGPPAEVENPADGSGMDPSQGSWLAEYRRLCSQAPPADKAADDLRRSLDELPDDSRQRARDLGQELEDADDEARRLVEVIERRREADGIAAKAEAKARSDRHRRAWHRHRQQVA